jgi:hypothetical protein
VKAIRSRQINSEQNAEYCDVYAVGLRSRRYLVTARKATEEEGVTSQSQSQSYFTTDDQSVRKSWFQGP